MNDTTLPNPRRRTRPNSIRPGFALHDWMNLLRHAKDLSGRRGNPLRDDITLAEVSKHSATHDGWMVLRGKVYNISPYLMYHPGGSDILEKCLGRDGTKLFDRYHSWVNIENLIGPLLVGHLSKGETSRGAADEEERIGSGEQYLNETDSGKDIVLPSSGASLASAKEIEFAMPKPRPTAGQEIPSILGKPHAEDDNDEEDLLPP